MLRDAREADGRVRRGGSATARHAEREKTAVGVMAGCSAGLVMRRRCALRPSPVEQHGVEVRRPPDAGQEQGRDEERGDAGAARRHGLIPVTSSTSMAGEGGSSAANTYRRPPISLIVTVWMPFWLLVITG
jgi:hypothetical protein